MTRKGLPVSGIVPVRSGFFSWVTRGVYPEQQRVRVALPWTTLSAFLVQSA